MFSTRVSKGVVFVVLNLAVLLLFYSMYTDQHLLTFSDETTFYTEEKERTGVNKRVTDETKEGRTGLETIGGDHDAKDDSVSAQRLQEGTNEAVILETPDLSHSFIIRDEPVPKLDNMVGPDQTLRNKLDEALTDTSEIDLTEETGSNVTPVLYNAGRKLLNKDDFTDMMHSREEHLQSSCHRIFFQQRKNPQQHRIPILRADHFYALPNLKFAWCPVFKAASTNWLHNLLRLAGLGPAQISELQLKYPQQPNDQGRVVAPVISKDKLQELEKSENSSKLLIVRHPFDRLVSAFRDKLERCHGKDPCLIDDDWYYKTYGKKIVNKYRPAAVARFSEQYFSSENNYGSPLPVHGTFRTVDLPSWWEFIQYIIETSPVRYDEHWKPISLYCSVCSFTFNYILHFENIIEEEKMFGLELSKPNLIQDNWENRNDEGFKKEEIVGKYFSLLDDDDIKSLYEIYKDDFLAFGYQFEFRGLKLNVP